MFWVHTPSMRLKSPRFGEINTPVNPRLFHYFLEEYENTPHNP
jgi:hypothetical protein